MASAEDTTSAQEHAAMPSREPVVRLFFLASALFLVAGLALYLLAAAQLVSPELLEGTAELTYGRVYPAALNTILFGWLTVGLLGLAFHAVPRLTGGTPVPAIAQLAVLGLTAGGAGAGVAMILLGDSAGGRWLEFPIAIDGALALGYLAAAALLTRAARSGSRMPIGAFYLVAAPVWLFLSYAAGAVPGLEGLPAEVQAGFTSTALFGLWATASAVGVGYYTVSRLFPDAEFHPRLGRIGFWSLAVTSAWIAGRLLQYGPTNDWAETLPVLFVLGLVVAALAVVTDFSHALRGRWGEALSQPAGLLLAGGLFFLAAAPLIAAAASFRSSSAVLQFTSWESGYEQAALFGTAGLLLSAGVIAATRRAWGRMAGSVSAWLMGVGALVAVVSRLGAGLQQGYSWLAGVGADGPGNTGEAFQLSSAPLEGFNYVQMVGLGLFALGALVFALRLLTLATAESSGAVDPGDEGVSSQWLVRRAVALFAVVAFGGFVLPALDADADATLLADSSRLHAEGTNGDLGREVYIAEGCAYCHTQQVRAVVTDVGLGAVSAAGDYAHDPVGLAGVSRVGPDLAHQGTRGDSGEPAWIRDHLIDPRARRPWSVMPSYAHLSESELVALAVYVAGLR